MIAVIDYGMGNLHSVSKALERLEQAYTVTEDEAAIRAANAVILPGVGAFGDAMIELEKRKLIDVLQEVAASGRPMLGICLGMQLLLSSSTEGGGGDDRREHDGLGLIPGHVRRFSGKSAYGESYKVPHMGWNQLSVSQVGHPLLSGVEYGFTYFVHSYVATQIDSANLLAETNYYTRVPAIIGQDNVVGMQFHPEKSGTTGMQLLRNFCEQFVKKGGVAVGRN